jgi:hypothetical protein
MRLLNRERARGTHEQKPEDAPGKQTARHKEEGRERQSKTSWRINGKRVNEWWLMTHFVL